MIDHSIIADFAGVADALARNAELEYERNRERYTFLRWAQQAFQTLRVFPPDRGICHQVNLEYLAQVVFRDGDGLAYPDTLVGTDSHTPMVNGLGVLGWGVGGIEAEAAMLGQPISMLLPRVVGIKLDRRAPDRVDRDRSRAHRRASCCASTAWSASSSSSTARASAACRSRTGRRSATCRPSTARRARSSRSTTRRCATCARPAGPTISSRWSRRTRRSRASGTTPTSVPQYDETIELDLATVEPSLAGPARPAGSRVARCASCERRWRSARGAAPAIARGDRRASRRLAAPPATRRRVASCADGAPCVRRCADGRRHVVIAAITSCTNTSNPSVMIAAGLLARNAVDARAHGSAVGEDVARARLARRHRLLRARPGLHGAAARSSASTSSATAARRASATPVRSRPRSRRRSTDARPLGVRRCSRATATSRAASIPTAA